LKVGRFTTEAKSGVEFGELQFIAAGTPQDEYGAANFKYVLKVAETIATYMQSKVIIEKSTVTVGTASKVCLKVPQVLDNRESALQFSILSNPELLKEGAAVNDCQHSARIVIVISTDSTEAEKSKRELYQHPTSP
jgi:UDPglucose 6-dehydrogenase